MTRRPAFLIPKPKPPPVCENCGAPYDGKGPVRICADCPPVVAGPVDREMLEEHIQKAMVGVIGWEFKEVFVWRTPNQSIFAGLVQKHLGRQRGVKVLGIVATLLKSLGLRPGIPDLALACPGGRILFVEVKTTTGYLSDEQIEVHARLRSLGFTVVVSRTVDDLRQKLKAFLAA